MVSATAKMREWALFGGAQPCPRGRSRAMGSLPKFRCSDVLMSRPTATNIGTSTLWAACRGVSGPSVAGTRLKRLRASGCKRAIGTSPAERAPPAPRGRPHGGPREIGISASRRSARHTRRSSRRRAGASGATKSEYRRQGNSQTPPAERPRLRPPCVHQALTRHYAPSAASWRRCCLAGSGSEIREYRRSSSECPWLSTRSRPSSVARTTPAITRPTPPDSVRGPDHGCTCNSAADRNGQRPQQCAYIIVDPRRHIALRPPRNAVGWRRW